MLAAGGGTRFGRPKAGVLIDGERLVDRAVRVLSDAGVEPVVVVLGAQVFDVRGARVVVNPHWAQGLSTSLRAGLAQCQALPGAALVIVPVDLPGLTAESINAVVRDSPDSLTVATYEGVRGHPVVIGRNRWSEVTSFSTGDSGARAYLERYADQVEFVEVGHLGEGQDLDHPPGTQR